MGIALAASAFAADNAWPPAKQLAAVLPAQNAAPLPPSISAEPISAEEWRCTFRYRPKAQATRVCLVGSFNNWDRTACALAGPNPDGDWTATLALATGAYQYKFLVNGDEWNTDPANPELVPDSFGGSNSFVRIGRLAQMERSEATVGDSKIDAAGLAHQCPEPLYVQTLPTGEIAVRYRTFAHDVKQIWVAVKGGPQQEMSVVCAGPLFAYWEATLPPNGGEKAGARGINYTFVLDDGGERAGDPYLYYYPLNPASSVATPEWAQNAVWYELMLDRFCNGDPGNDPDPVRPWTSEWFTPSPWEGKDGQTFYEHFAFDRHYGGDLAGLEARLPYLRELGVTAIYLTPIFKAPSYHKYDIQSHLHVDDGFGLRGDYDKVAAQEDLLDPATWQWTETDRRFLTFIEHAHAAGIHVMLDAVFNYVGLEHAAFKDVVKNGKRSRFADWFDVTSWEPFAYTGWAGFANMPVFHKDRQGFASPTLTKYLFAVTRRWMDPNGDGNPADGIDGWRLDVPNDIPRTFWAEWRQHVKSINPNALITGEMWHRADKWLDGKHFDSVTNYEFAGTAVGWIFDHAHKLPASAAAAHLKELQLAYPPAAGFALLNVLDTHDTDRLASMAQNPDREYDRQNRVQDNNQKYDNSKPAPAAYARARLAALLQATSVGAPLLYYGDEVGMWGADDPTNRKPMLWTDLQPYDKPEENAVMPDQLAFYKQVFALRAAHPALCTGAFDTLLTDDTADVWAFRRHTAKESVIVALNASDSERQVTVPLPAGSATAWTFIFGGKGDATAADNQLKLTIPAVSGVVLQAAGK